MQEDLVTVAVPRSRLTEVYALLGAPQAPTDVRPPEDTEWGQHEGVLIDPDGNMIRFGSPIKR